MSNVFKVGQIWKRTDLEPEIIIDFDEDGNIITNKNIWLKEALLNINTYYKWELIQDVDSDELVNNIEQSNQETDEERIMRITRLMCGG